MGRAVAVLVALTVMLAACTPAAAPPAVSGTDTALRVGGLDVTDGPSGVRADAPAPLRTAKHSDGSVADRLALLAVDDVEQYWRSQYPQLFGREFAPVRKLISYDSNDPDSHRICLRHQYKNPNAMFCRLDNSLAWDRGALIPAGQKYFGDQAIAALIAHEYGHAVQSSADLVEFRTDTIVREQQADCFAGAYLHWVAEGGSPRFVTSTGDGLNHVLAAAISIRDPVLEPGQEEMIEGGHGTALDRISAFQLGFDGGPATCTRIDLPEIEQRRGDLPMELGLTSYGAAQSGEVPVDEQTLATLMELLGQVFRPVSPPTLSFAEPDCPGVAPSPPASYCPATNSIAVNLPLLQQLSVPADEANRVLPQGDNTAISMVTSRYVLQVQQSRGEPLDQPKTALHTACLTGVAQHAMARPIPLPSGNTLMLSAGDVDEAVAGLLTNGIAASTVDGATVPAGFTRIEAFRAGLSSTEDQCFQRY